MFSKAIIEDLEKKSKEMFEDIISSLDENEVGDLLYDTWNSCCKCRGCDGGQIFDFDNEEDLKLWEENYGKRHYQMMKFGLFEEDAINSEIHITYLDVPRLKSLVCNVFDTIYQYVITQPWCFCSKLQMICLQPIIKESGVANPSVVGYLSEIINDNNLYASKK